MKTNISILIVFENKLYNNQWIAFKNVSYYLHKISENNAFELKTICYTSFDQIICSNVPIYLAKDHKLNDGSHEICTDQNLDHSIKQ